jgi:UDP-glucose:(heptosyl)LPS alpha-1,3-glucosyltransferase
VHVIHNAVDTTEFSPANRTALRADMRARWAIPDEAFCLLFLGHNFRLKGLWQVLDVVAGLAPDGPDVHLLVAGRGTGEGQRRKARRLVEARGMWDRVTLAGPVRPPLHALAASDALLHLSWHDSFGFAVLEAMACGLPVVTTPYTGVSELIEDRVSGRVVDPARDSEVVAAIRDLSSPRYRDTIGAAGADVASRHDEESNFRRVLEVLEVAANRRRGPLRF